VRPASAYVVAVRPLAIWFPAPGVKPDVVERNTLYVTPVAVDAVHERLMPVLDAAVAASAVGAAGGGDDEPGVYTLTSTTDHQFAGVVLVWTMRR
jgi:hypothetical protein